MKIENEYVRVVQNNITPKSIIRAITESGKQDEAFYVMNVGEVVRKHELWLKTVPKIKPFYAVKCNDSKIVLRLLAALGTGFDCASKGEISRVLSLGVPPEKIIFANPAKPSSHIKYASKVGVNLLTFDSQSELFKIKELHPKAKLILRIRSDAKDSQCPLGFKFGAEESSIRTLIQLAVKLGLELVGVSFHVGSGCRDLNAFAKGITSACETFLEMESHGAVPYILDIGGGFQESTFQKVSLTINQALESLPTGISVIAEPGRYYVDSAYTLATAIHGIRGKEYYINDGVYGSFNCVLYDHASPLPLSLKECHDEGLEGFKIWGPTCDSLDMVADNVLLPQLEIGDWLVWECMGAYTLPVCSTFNGFPVPNVFYIASEDVWKIIQNVLALANPEDKFDTIDLNLALLQTVSS